MNAAERARRYRETHRDEISERRRAERQADPEKFRERSRRWRATNPGAMAAHGRRENAANKQAVFGHYGWACACCGTSDDLSIDHVTPQEGPKLVGSALYRWLIANDFPAGFQTLCRPCNRSKGRGERCRIDHRPPCTYCGGSGKGPATKLRTRVLAAANGQHPQETNGGDDEHA